jgi:hypothetical protein
MMVGHAALATMGASVAATKTINPQRARNRALIFFMVEPLFD